MNSWKAAGQRYAVAEQADITSNTDCAPPASFGAQAQFPNPNP